MVRVGIAAWVDSVTAIDITCTQSQELVIMWLQDNDVVTCTYIVLCDIACTQISSQHLENFLAKIEAGYGRYGNPYHNATHAADVAITTHYFIHSLGLKVRVIHSRLL